MNNFVYDIPTKVYFGKNQIENNLGKELASFGKNVLLVYGGGSIKKTGLYDKVIKELKKENLKVTELSGIAPNPRVDSVREGGRICKEKSIDVILAVGGGSVIDAAKFMGAAAYYEGDAWDLSTRKADIKKCLPIVTVLTLSATGSEMDCGGVISNPETKDKLGRMERPMLPSVSFLDPENTFTVSKYQTACGAADILSHLFEVYFDMSKGFYMLDCFMEGLMKTVIKFTPIALKDPENYEARANLMWASSWAINGFINGGRNIEWSCHPIEHEVSAIYDITHGLGLAVITPRWMRYCLDDSTEDKFCQFGINVFDIDKSLPKKEIAEESIKRLESFLFETIGLDSDFKALNIDENTIKIMAKKACGGKHINGFKKLYAEDIEKILKNCL